jgi:aspartyl-tRNA(Asn)/glutamyl-tRNA(Gln) amidotransferase subunit A
MSDDPATMSAEDLLAQYARGDLSPVEALQAVTERVARHNPALNAFAVLDPRALLAARESEGRWRAGRPLGALDGVPCTVKDLVDLAGLPTRRGSRTTSADPAAADGPAVLGLKSAGAVILGKTTTTEFGWKSPGDCPLHGITRNPWNPAYSPGGSSSGAGAAAAAGFGPLHLGTDAGGSVRIPAAWCGVVGLKPSFGRVPQWPLSAFGSVSCAGPMTRTVRDAALMLSALARHDGRDPYCLPDDPRDWRTGIEDGVVGLRVSVLRAPGFEAPVDADGIAAVEQAAALLADAGAEIVDENPGLPDAGAAFAQLWGLSLAALAGAMTPEQRALLDTGILGVAAHHAGAGGLAVMAGEAARVQAAHRMALFHRRFDLVLCPTVPGPPPLADAPTGDAMSALLRDWAPWTLLFNLTRQPAITVPLGMTGAGLPRSVQLAAGLYRDDLVLRAARVLEHAIPVPLAPSPSGRGLG